MNKCPSIESGQAGKAESCKGCPNANICASSKPDEDIPLMKENLSSIKTIIAIMSGKGGVGKSTISRNIASSFSKKKMKTVLLDFDLSGPSIPRLTKTEDKFIICTNNQKFKPIEVDEMLGVVSIGHLEHFDDQIRVFNTNLKNYSIKKILKYCDFSGYDVMIIDTPPNISEEHLALVNYIKPHYSIIISASQVISLNDVRRQVSFCKKVNMPILGLIENMKGFECPRCQHTNNISVGDPVKDFCIEQGIEYLGSMPFQVSIAKESDSGNSFENEIFGNIVGSIINNSIFRSN